MAGVDKLFCKGQTEKFGAFVGWLYAVSVPTIHLCSCSNKAAVTIWKQMDIPVF